MTEIPKHIREEVDAIFTTYGDDKDGLLYGAVCAAICEAERRSKQDIGERLQKMESEAEEIRAAARREIGRKHLDIAAEAQRCALGYPDQHPFDNGARDACYRIARVFRQKVESMYADPHHATYSMPIEDPNVGRGS